MTESFERKKTDILQRHCIPEGLDAIAERASVSELASILNRSPSSESRNYLKGSIVSGGSFTNIKDESKLLTQSPQLASNPFSNHKNIYQSHRPKISESKSKRLIMYNEHIEEEDEYEGESRTRTPKMQKKEKSKRKNNMIKEKGGSNTRVRHRDQPKRQAETNN